MTAEWHSPCIQQQKAHACSAFIFIGISRPTLILSLDSLLLSLTERPYACFGLLVLMLWAIIVAECCASEHATYRSYSLLLRGALKEVELKLLKVDHQPSPFLQITVQQNVIIVKNCKIQRHKFAMSAAAPPIELCRTCAHENI